ncbi:murein transglycosylase A [Sphingomonas antarctica]|uniref:murein transglycosylase A n=1 Tax=Sphingomonas antarctica TaxID=2040274 RepID=UPI0039EBEF2F
MGHLRPALAAVLCLAISACVGAPKRQPVRVAPPPATRPAPPAPIVVTPPPPANAVAAGVTSASFPPITLDNATRALTAFRATCPALLRRSDVSGLTQTADWRAACDAAATADPASFFAQNFAAIRVGDGAAKATGYFEPEIAGSRTQSPDYPVPVYARPGDIVTGPIQVCPDDPTTGPCQTKQRRGRYDETGAFVPYWDRGQIEDGALAGKGLEIAWAADPIDLFFLEVQGSGRLRLPDGSVMRIGYAGQNGHDYTGIGSLMKSRNLLGPGQTSMQGIVAYLRAHPDEGRAIMRENRSYVFFKELTGPGPLGALNVAVVGGISIAADPAFVPLGAPFWMDVDRPEADGLWIAQDTGGAIKGANRIDTFWGAGDEAKRIAGGMLARGTAVVLVPLSAAARLLTNAPARP